MHIACVEDNPVNMALVQRVAGMTKHTIVSYSEGEVAQLELLNQRFDLILMDVELAGEISGLQVVRTLRQKGLLTPIIAMTAYAMAGDRDRCIEAGCTDYLSKPIVIADLLKLLNDYSEKLATEAGTAKSAEVKPPVVAESPAVTAPTTTPATTAAGTVATGTTDPAVAPPTPPSSAPGDVAIGAAVSVTPIVPAGQTPAIQANPVTPGVPLKLSSEQTAKDHAAE